jgi:hexosaminidase
MKRYHLASLLLVYFLPASAQNLLPAVREMHLGSGRFSLEHARVCGGDPLVVKELRLSAGPCLGQVLSHVIVLHQTGTGGALPVPGETPGPESREAYTIHVTSDRVDVESKSSAGIYYAVQTLKQLVTGKPRPYLPEVTIRDWPLLAYRGFMMDMSHSQLPTFAEIRHQIDLLASWKINQYYFYSEATLSLDGFPLLPPEGRYTKEEVAGIIRYAAARHIDVIPNFELYGHLHDLFRMERYSDLAVIPHGGEFKRGDPRVQPIVAAWVAQIAALFPSLFFHVGFDETWLLEREAARLHRRPEDLFLEQLQAVCDLLRAQGKTPMAWADMMEKYPQMIPRLPKGLIAFPWHYSPLPEAEYDRFFAPFGEAHVPIVVQSAVSTWRWLVPDFASTFENDDRLVAAGVKHHALGFLSSGWSDNTQVLMRMAEPALAHAAAVAWQGAAPATETFFERYAAVQYGASGARFAEALAHLTRAETALQNAQGPSTIDAFWDNAFSKRRLERSTAHADALRECRLEAQHAIELLEGMPAPVDPVTVKALLVGARMLDYTALKYIYAVEISRFWQELGERPSKHDVITLIGLESGAIYHSRAEDMLDGISQLRDQFREAWLDEYKPFRLTLALSKYDSEFQFWWILQQRLQHLNSGFKDGDRLPPLDSLLQGLP